MRNLMLLIAIACTLCCSRLQVSAESSEFGAVYVGRELLEAPSLEATTTSPPRVGNVTFINKDDCFMLYAYSIKLLRTLKTGSSILTLPALNNETLNGNTIKAVCDNSSADVTFTWNKDIMDLKEVILHLSFNTSAYKFWSINTAFLTVSCSNGTQETNCTNLNAPLVVNWLETPVGYSYHCTDDPDSNIITTKNKTNVFIQFSRLQIQVGRITGGKFGYHNDCTGFFTINVWSVWFVSIILVVILAYALTMITNIITMDRFDDPKGKPLQVSTAAAAH